jgi:hypothetical protein
MPLSIKGRGRKKGIIYTKEYIEKVSKAKEIQKLWKQKVGDWIFDYQYFTPFLLDKKLEGLNKPTVVVGWLPTLEQLFEMIQGTCPFDKLDDFYHWAKSQYLKHKTLSEYLLCFVMEETYHKQWNPDKREWEAIE